VPRLLDNPLILNCSWGSQSWLPPASAGAPQPARFLPPETLRKERPPLMSTLARRL